MKLPLDPAWLSKTPVEAIVCHWTAGGSECGDDELSHYHLIIDQDPRVHRGHHSIADNSRPLSPGSYAAHCLGFNRYKGRAVIGIAVCGMRGASEATHSPGPDPITAEQMDLLTRCVAQLCVAYGISVTPENVLMHGEVSANRGIAQRGKWDICWLPYKPSLSPAKVCSNFRATVAKYVEEIEAPFAPPTRISRLLIYVNGKPVPVPGATLVKGSWSASPAAINAALGSAVVSSAMAPLRTLLLLAGYSIDEISTARGNHLSDPANPRQYVFIKKRS